MAQSEHRQLIQPETFIPLTVSAPARRRRGPSLWLLLIPVLLLFALVMWFLMTAQSVLFTFDPPESRLNIDGRAHLQLGKRYLLLPGRYRITASAPGYYPLEQELILGEQEQQQFHYQLQALPGKLDIVSRPSGASVEIDGEFRGHTPLGELTVAAGEHRLTLQARRYSSYRAQIAVKGRGELQQFEISLQPAWANISIDSTPSGATVLVDGEAMGVTPALLEVLQGERQVALQLPRYRIWQQSLEVIAGEHQTLPPITLQAAASTLSLGSEPSQANVTVDGEYRGQTPLALELSPGSPHRIAVFKPGYRRVIRELTLQPEQRRELQIRLAARLGEVLVEVQPEDAEILVNGVSKGRGGRKLQLPAFEQTLEVSRQGYRAQRRRFTPRTGISQIIQVQLQTEEEAELAALKAEITSHGGQTLGLFSPGDFTMGASRREPGRRANEVLHPVSLTRRFYFSYHEVSNAEFRKFQPGHESGRVEENSLNLDRQPVVKVSWNDAARYCNWLSEADNLPAFYHLQDGEVTGFDPDSHGYRLPSEAEWAWLARSREDGLLKYPWGSGYPPQQVLENYADDSSAHITGRTVQGYNDGHVVSAPIASFAANDHGIYDLGGNVAEWVHDVYGLADTRGAVVVDPLGAQTGNHHVIRGAGWAHGAVTELRLSFRDYGQASRDDVGFRIARYAEER